MSPAPEQLPLPLGAATFVHRTAPNTYSGIVSADFCYASALALPTAHGGYIGSMIMRAIRQHFQDSHAGLNQPDAFTVHFRFLEASNAGPMTIEIRDVKMGKNTSTVHFTASQSQGNKNGNVNKIAKVVGYATHFNAWSRIGKGFTYAKQLPLLQPPPLPADFAKLNSNTDPNWIVHSTPYNPSHKVKSQTQCRFALPRQGMPHGAVSDGWLSPVQPGERYTNVSLGWLADQWPQGVPDYRPQPSDGSDPNRVDYGLLNTPRGIWEANMWYPTMTMDIELKRPLPDEGVEWVFIRSQSKVIRDGRMDLEVWIFAMFDNDDGDGGKASRKLDVVAISHHVCLVVALKGNVDRGREKL